jgi:hypothetical protein
MQSSASSWALIGSLLALLLLIVCGILLFIFVLRWRRSQACESEDELEVEPSGQTVTVADSDSFASQYLSDSALDSQCGRTGDDDSADWGTSSDTHNASLSEIAIESCSAVDSCGYPAPGGDEEPNFHDSDFHPHSSDNVCYSDGDDDWE